MNITPLLATAIESDLETEINAFNINSVLIASLALVVLLLLSAFVIKNKKHKAFKKPLFILIVITVAIPTLFMTGSSVYLNTVSDSKGPVHWHTDIEFWVCGEEIELRDPVSALSNKIGTSTYHEHDDKRIHLEGVVLDLEVDAGLEKLMRVTGGELSETTLIIPTEDSLFEDDYDGDQVSNNKQLVSQFKEADKDGRAILSVQNGMTCSSGGKAAEVQTFVYSYNKADDTYTQTKLENPGNYSMRDESIVPPGDCVIVEFDTPKNSTDKLCQQYGVKDSERCVDFGVKQYNPDLCYIREINKNPNDEMIQGAL